MIGCCAGNILSPDDIHMVRQQRICFAGVDACDGAIDNQGGTFASNQAIDRVTIRNVELVMSERDDVMMGGHLAREFSSD